MKRIDPKNLSAMLAHRGRGNPPSVHPSSAVANCFPGLELDFRNLWKQLFEGIELHESALYVLDVTSPRAIQAGIEEGSRLLALRAADGDGALEVTLEAPLVGPGIRPGNATHFEWTNAVSELARRFAGQEVEADFEIRGGAQATVALTVTRLLDGPTIREEAAPSGKLTHGLCSPWQADFRECGCYYWAASRPDFVNVDETSQPARGHNWLVAEKDEANRTYDAVTPHVSYDELYGAWEEKLSFVIAGKELK